MNQNLISKYRQTYDPQQIRWKYIDCGLRIFSRLSIVDYPENIFHMREIVDSLIDKREIMAYKTEVGFYEIGCPQGIERFRQLAKKWQIKK